MDLRQRTQVVIAARLEKARVANAPILQSPTTAAPPFHARPHPGNGGTYSGSSARCPGTIRGHRQLPGSRADSIDLDLGQVRAVVLAMPNWNSPSSVTRQHLRRPVLSRRTRSACRSYTRSRCWVKPEFAVARYTDQQIQPISRTRRRSGVYASMTGRWRLPIRTLSTASARECRDFEEARPSRWSPGYFAMVFPCIW